MTEIKYNGSVVATVEGGNTATLPVKDLKMKSDIVITVPEAENGSAVIVVATEAEAKDTTTIPIVNGQVIIVGV